jgi:hypothetical protein
MSDSSEILKSRRFSPGQRVIIPRAKPPLDAGKVYRIVRREPTEDGARTQYRIKSENDAFERVVDEVTLEIAGG